MYAKSKQFQNLPLQRIALHNLIRNEIRTEALFHLHLPNDDDMSKHQRQTQIQLFDQYESKNNGNDELDSQQLHEMINERRRRGFDLLFETRHHRAQRLVFQHAQVVVTTCSTAGDKRLKKIIFRAVVIDECTQATEPECLIPIMLGVKHVVLIGDHKQLGPIII